MVFEGDHTGYSTAKYMRPQRNCAFRSLIPTFDKKFMGSFPLVKALTFLYFKGLQLVGKFRSRAKMGDSVENQVPLMEKHFCDSLLRPEFLSFSAAFVFPVPLLLLVERFLNPEWLEIR